MSFVDEIAGGKSIYVIPRGSKNAEGVIHIQSRSGSARLEVFFPNDKYQVISDKTLEDRKIGLDRYIQDTESWRKNK